ncbi:hypothetical protein SCYAM73S_01037 [Streptomyces cyaneofuscatus]
MSRAARKCCTVVGGELEQGGAAELVQQDRAVLRAGRLLQGTFQTAPGRFRGADREVLARGFAELGDKLLVIVRVVLQGAGRPRRHRARLG